MHSFGTDLLVFEGNGLRISETSLSRGLQLPEHAHTPGQICYILEGTYLERLSDGERRFSPGTLQVHAPGEVHSNHFGEDEDVLTLLISIDPGRWLPTASRQPKTMVDDVTAEIRHEMRRGDDTARVAMEGLALLTLSRVARSNDLSSSEPVWLADAVAWIERRFNERITLSSVAEAIGTPRGTVAAAFRRFRRRSVGEVIRGARIRRAKALLLTGMPLAEIALSTGFHDQGHFTRAFRAETGNTPGNYRLRNRGTGS